MGVCGLVSEAVILLPIKNGDGWHHETGINLTQPAQAMPA
jgi:hypothetical protein